MLEQANVKELKELIDTAMSVEGMPRNSSTHAAGIVITDRPVSDYVPLAKNDESVLTQFTMTTIEELGLLKMDFLGLRTLTVINDCVKMVKKKNPDFDIEKISYRLTAPGIGREVGASLGFNRNLYQGFFMSPHIVAQSIKVSMVCAEMFKNLGYEVCPKPDSDRSDIIQAIKFNDKDKLIKFCQSIQYGSAIDSFVTPEPWDMPGYSDAVIMAAGTSSRFAPLSYEMPKALITVKGEVLIERQIRQLKEAGIDEIYIVTGYKAEMFSYLEGKFGVHLVHNPDFLTRNNNASIYAVKDILKNSYICSPLRVTLTPMMLPSLSLKLATDFFA